MSKTYTTEDFVRALKGTTLTAYTGTEYTYTTSTAPTRNEEFERFEDLASKLLAVPKTEVSEG